MIAVKSIAIGSFDGLHIAHQSLVSRADALVIIERGGGYLTPGYRRSFFTDKICFFYHFEVIRGLSPESFVAKLKEDFPMLEKIVVGYDFSFGKNKAGNVETLAALFDAKVEVVEEVSVEEISVHSRTIKAYLKEGDIAQVTKLLGRAYLIEGEVISGQGLGKEKLFPTLNLEIQHYQLPLEGVYATQTYIKGQWLDSVSFVGHRVSTDGVFSVESYVLDDSLGKIKGMVKLMFIALLRKNEKFDTLEALKAQITQDIERTKEILA